MMADVKNDALFYQRLSELADRCVTRYSPEFSHFLDGRYLVLACEYLKGNCGADVRVVTFGGFDGAERRVVGLFPKDIYPEDSMVDEELYEMFGLSAVEILGSGFSVFSHRDVMGSVLGLGMKREAIGDIYVTDDKKHAYICLTSVAANFLCESLDFVSRDKVKVKAVEVNELPIPERKFSVISGTVASERLDCIVSLATNLSREKSKQLVASGLVSVNHLEEMRCDFQLCESDVISIRGYGRFRLVELGGVTRKGRNRVIIHKMI